MGNVLVVYFYFFIFNWIQVVGIKFFNGFFNGFSWFMVQFVVVVVVLQEIRVWVMVVYFFFGSIVFFFGNYVYVYIIDLGFFGQMWVFFVFFVLIGLIMIIVYIFLNDWVVLKREKKSF